jgi:26S proteasome regulatory subunit N2
LTDIVERMFNRCFSDGEYKQALGIAIEARRIDKVRDAILKSGKVHEMLDYCFLISMNIIKNREFRHSLLTTLVELYLGEQNPDYLGVTQCLTFLDDSQQVASILSKLVSISVGKSDKDDTHTLIAYQVAFDLQDRAPQHFLQSVAKQLADTLTVKSDESETVASDATTYDGRLNKVLRILGGKETIHLYVDFLRHSNHSDLQILNNIKASFDRNSILHSATVTSNAYMHAGTSYDKFLRDNLEWLGKASNWSKFSATASLGVIHKGRIEESINILKPYLPSGFGEANVQTSVSSTGGSGGGGGGARGGSGSGSVYSEGGALFALGIIHSNHGDNMTQNLLDIVKNEATDPVVQHGASFGLGLCAMATGDEALYEKLKDILYLDNAISGEAAGVSMGLVMMGTANEKCIDEMFAYAHETAHEKIIRGLAIGMALTVYGREEGANDLIDKLVADKDPILRYGGMYTIGLAYCGTNNNTAIRKLLQIAVSDVSDDVRRAAVMNLGFLLFKTPKQCPRLVSLLAESYNPHVRYGVALAIGISCAGTGLKEALEILDTLSKDPVDFVRQGALIATSMTLMQYNEVQSPKVSEYRKNLEKVWTTRGEEIMCKVGAILSAGIIDAGGRNATVCLHKGGHNKMRNIVGIALFTQYWFWYPYLHFLSMAFEPTVVLGLNSDLKIPKYEFTSSARPSLFAYPAKMKAAQEKKEVKVGPTAELSMTAKAKARSERRKRREEARLRGEIMEDDMTPTPTPTPKSGEDKLEKKDEQSDQEKKKEKKKPEPKFEILQNPARVTPSQLQYIKFDRNDRYVPVQYAKNETPTDYGILILKDLKSNESEEFVDLKVGSSSSDDTADEPQPPQAFEYP